MLNRTELRELTPTERLLAIEEHAHQMHAILRDIGERRSLCDLGKYETRLTRMREEQQRQPYRKEPGEVDAIDHFEREVQSVRDEVQRLDVEYQAARETWERAARLAENCRRYVADQKLAAPAGSRLPVEVRS